MRCHRYCGGATDSVHRQSSGYPDCAREMLVPVYEGPVCVPETCDGNRDCRDEGDRRMRLILLFGIPTPGARRCERIQRMREDCKQQIRERGDARAHECLSMDVDDPCDEVPLVLPKAECTSKRRVSRTLDIQCIQ